MKKRLREREMQMQRKISPLTPEEQKFAAENSNMIFDFMKKHNLPFQEFYGMLACRYILSVRDWFSRPELHKWAFATIAYRAMHGTYATWVRQQYKAKNSATLVSLDSYICDDEHEDDFLSTFYQDSFRVEDHVVCKSMLQRAFAKLKPAQQKACAMVAKGYKGVEAAKELSLHQPYVSAAMKQFKTNYYMEES